MKYIFNCNQTGEISGSEIRDDAAGVQSAIFPRKAWLFTDYKANKICEVPGLVTP